MDNESMASEMAKIFKLATSSLQRIYRFTSNTSTTPTPLAAFNTEISIEHLVDNIHTNSVTADHIDRLLVDLLVLKSLVADGGAAPLPIPSKPILTPTAPPQTPAPKTPVKPAPRVGIAPNPDALDLMHGKPLSTKLTISDYTTPAEAIKAADEKFRQAAVAVATKKG
jgi:hypothetical protein